MDAGSTGTAVVLGGGMAGLLAASVLADHAPDVRVLDRDDLTVGGQRRGVPQARHIHALLPRGRDALDALLPGLPEELEAEGAPAGDLLGEARLHLSGHRLKRTATGLRAISTSRTFLEDHVRARVRRLPTVTFSEPCDVLGLLTTPDRRRVTGVRVLRRADGSAAEDLEGDLVIDALGRGSRTPALLEATGYQPPEEERVTVDLAYATCTYRLPDGALGGDWGTLEGPTPTRPRGGALARLEGDRWMLTLFGFLGDHPPTDPEGFLAFARSLTFPDIHEAIRDASPLDDPVAFRFPASLRRRYEHASRLPAGLVPLGDSVCSLDPVYGQGMTVAALEALLLRDHLRRGRALDPRRFVRDLARVVDPAWDAVVGGDLALPGADGPRTPKVRLAGAYASRVHAAAALDAELATAVVRVMGLVDRPGTLLRPKLVLRVLGALRHRPRESGATSARRPGTTGRPRRQPMTRPRRRC